MVDRIARPIMGSTVLLFGPQALSFDETHFNHLRTSVIEIDDCSWILETLADLPQWWETIVDHMPKLKTEEGLKMLKELNDWFQTGRFPSRTGNLPNVVLNPLVVISQLSHYYKYAELAGTKSQHRKGTVGFCTGLLTAFAVSSSDSKEDLQRYGASALRLAMLIGMAVDAQDATALTGDSKSLATVWRTDKEKTEMDCILQRFPETYISVYYDENRATVTTASKAIAQLQQELRTAGITVTEVGLHGRFHSDIYSADLEALSTFCDSHPEFRFQDPSALVLPTWANNGSEYITTGTLHHEALRSILVEPPQWYRTLAGIRDSHLQEEESLVVSLGLERCVPPSIMRGIGSKVIHLSDIESSRSASDAQKDVRLFTDNDIAVVGMSCKTAGADNLDEFWQLLCQGKSQHKEVPKDRFGFETVHRETDPARKWFGNFIDDYDTFDHKFFKKSPREIASTDPQQRWILQIAYQAVEQSGYFLKPHPDREIGCYVGVCACDYENNVACHAPNAFTATGNLKGFIAGKVSHYFGWTGPGLTIDTACSSSAVAVHQACRAILSGECKAALAGGTHVMTNPLWFQNLAGATFLSTTGQCKPFDSKADGYCRGEGVAAVFLKKMSDAIADGDNIIGSIAATAVQQNENCTPIFVPNSPSLSDLFGRVIDKARIKPHQISVVEAHGTGTPVGDPVEYESVLRVMGGPVRSDSLALSSVKGLVGHLECTSGIISLIKILLMIYNKAIPPQASFSTMNPAIKASSSDHIKVPTSLQPWEADFRAALINNYGASGSNASLVVTQAPSGNGIQTSDKSATKAPFWFCGLDDRALRTYLKALKKLLDRADVSSTEMSVRNVSFNLARQSNRSLESAVMFTCKSTDELRKKLSQYEDESVSLDSVKVPAERPVIFCFGGQISTFVGLNREIYDNVAVFRDHLDACDNMCRSLGASSLYPTIFERTPVDDPVKLQTALFATQYASAKTWIACGVKPVAVVGHSFGELTASCISGSLTLRDALKMVINRATIIKERWGSDRGAMMAVEGDLADIENLLLKSSKVDPDESPANIACFNGPRSFTLAGSTKAIDNVVNTLAEDKSFASINSKKLNVSNAFHSALVDRLVDLLDSSAQDLQFTETAIPWERATELSASSKPNVNFVAEHMRSPVFFSHAVQRLAQRYPSSIFLEAGSNSTITSMASRALGSPKQIHFQAVNITNDGNLDKLADTTLNLWKAGLRVASWTHHSSQKHSYTPLLLPPYQFERSRHWLELKSPPRFSSAKTSKDSDVEKQPEGLLTFMEYQGSKKEIGVFRVNTMIEKYKTLLAGHLIAQTAPICPATVQLDLAIEGVRNLRPDLVASDMEPQVQGVSNQSPVCIDSSRSLWLEVGMIDGNSKNWNFRIFSTGQQKGKSSTTHTAGKIVFRSINDQDFKLEFARYGRLVDHQRCLDILNNSDTADDVIQGRNIYKTFAEIVDYSEEYRGLQKLVGRYNESAGRLVKKYNPETWLDAHLADSFCQTGGIWVNCMTDRNPQDMYIANAIEQWIRSPGLRQDFKDAGAWNVYARHSSVSEKVFLTDIFVFEASTGALAEVILGISYTRVPKSWMSSLLSRLTVQDDKAPAVNAVAPKSAMANNDYAVITQVKEPEAKGQSPVVVVTEHSKPKKQAKEPSRPSVLPKIKEILADISGLDLEEIKDDSELANLGIDSLMGMELARELETSFNCTFSKDDLTLVTDIPSLLSCVQSAIGVIDSNDDGSDSEAESRGSSNSTDNSSVFTHSDEETYPSTPAEFEVIDKLEAVAHDLILPPEVVSAAFEATKCMTDKTIADEGCDDYSDLVLPAQTELCIALTIEAFERSGCSLRAAKTGEQIERVKHTNEHRKLVDYLYQMLAKEGGFVEINGDSIKRTNIELPNKSSDQVLQELLHKFPKHAGANKLTHYAGAHLNEILSGETDGIKLIFGSDEGRELVSGLYGDWPLNRVFYKQMENFLERLTAKLPANGGPLKILEMGAGTGGTTKWLVPLLAELNFPVEYTFTDLAPSFVAAARKRFKKYGFMKFRTHDIEKSPADDLLATQHIIIASNAVHATHSLAKSTENIRKALRPDGMLMMLEMTGTLYWVDMIFGLFEGWWFFDDDRTHAVTHESKWKQDMQQVGYGDVYWTDGDRPENKLEKLIVAMASCSRYDRAPTPSQPSKSRTADLAERQSAVDEYVRKKTEGWVGPTRREARPAGNDISKTVLITGASGSLGSHLVSHFAQLSDVGRIICVNRRSGENPQQRQKQALKSKGIFLSEDEMNKISIFETDMAKPSLGLSREEYDGLVQSVTHIVHNAWLMSAKRPLDGFRTQFNIMRNMLDLARDISCNTPAGTKVTFQFVSSIAVVGYYPVWSGNPNVPEERMTIESVLDNGYGDAKYICELMLDETLHKYPQHFRTMAVRIGQIAGSSTSGYWNPMEHLSFLWKSSQTLNAMPNFDGVLSWTPVNHVAGTLGDLLLAENVPYPIYHIDNPVRQPWREMIPVLADALRIPRENVIPFYEWVQRVRNGPGAEDSANPAAKLIDFLDDNFVRMSCGGLLLSSAKTREHSPILSSVGPVSFDVARKFVAAWKDMRFLS